MISQALTILERGLKMMRLNTRLLMVGVLVFVFPLLFVWITQSFFTTAYSNIDTAEKQRIGLLHDTLQVVVAQSSNPDLLVPTLIAKVKQENSDVTKVRIVEPTSDGMLIQYSGVEAELGTYVQSADLFMNLPLSSASGAFIYPTSFSGVRTWQVFSSVERDGQTQYIFTEHSFGLVDSVMLARQQQSYFGLTAIFLFLIGLAYWLNKQVYWEKHHDKLAQQLKERDLFSNMIAHEFRSPLTAIKGYASFLEESENVSSDERRFATNVRISAERLVVLVSDFLEVARLQSGKMKIENQAVDVREVLTRVTEDLQPLAAQKGLTLTYEQPVQPLMMTTDSARLTQVITNIVSNAIKYTPDGIIEIECTKAVGEVTIRIKDTGMGISAEDQKKLFAPFMRVGGVDQTATTGTGLGMWITKQLVALLHGEIGVESIKGVGTHVVISFRT